MNLPIYRAKKKIDSDEYVVGFYEHISNEGRAINTVNSGDWISYIKLDNDGFRSRYEFAVDPTTLSISFPDMLDSQGNRIFASLQEDGKGGDILYYKSKIDLVTKTTVYFENYRLITHSKGENTFRDKESLSKFEVIGIKE